MNSLLKHTAIALAIIIPMAMYAVYANEGYSSDTAGDKQEAIPMSAQAEVQSVDYVNLDRYAGMWYEIARLPMFFQRNCASDVTATYKLNYGNANDTGSNSQQIGANESIASVDVINKCLSDDKEQIVADGIAIPADITGSKLNVTFLPKWLRWLPLGRADYWILALDDDYHYAMVGTPDKENLWILSRQPTLDQTTYNQLTKTAFEQGFDTTKLQITSHRNQASTVLAN